MTRGEAIQELEYIMTGHPANSARGQAVLMAIEALLKIEVIQDIIGMPFEWEQDDRRRYARIVDIVRKDLMQDGNN